MKEKDLINLLNRAAAGIEVLLTGSGDLTEDEVQDLLDDLDSAVNEIKHQQG